VGRALHRPALLPVPTLALDVILGREMAQEMLLGGQRVLPQKLLESGFTFRHPDLDLALRDALAAA
jgi:NAD dependent epimerase/dehydratase family enzyme